jgi:hypothetical protein
MSRPIIILAAIVIVIVAALIALSTLNTEVAPQPVEKPIANDALAQ